MIGATPLPREDLPPGAGRGARLLVALTRLLLIALAFLLAWQEVFDADVWWHVAAGHWILEHGRVPRLDPFSFASADRTWIDLHWLFQVLLAVAHRWVGVRGVVLLASALAATSVAVALAARRRAWPAWVTTAPWFPALLVMGWRLDPRPELVTLIGLATFLTVLSHAGRRPALVWWLVPAQVVWVNAHGLFILGPFLLAAYLVERALAGLGWLRAEPVSAEPTPWHVLVPAAVGVALACLANPYGPRGALFPLELFPKISAADNPYKVYIDEFMNLPAYVRAQTVAIAGRNLYFRAEHFLLLALPPSFLLPAIWGLAFRPAPAAADRPWVWGGVSALVFGLALAGAASLPGLGTPRWLIRFGGMVPLWVLALAICGAVLLARRSPAAALLALLGGGSSAAGLLWLRRTLLGPEPSLYAPVGALDAYAGCVAAVAGALAIPWLLRGGGSLFRLIVAGALSYLAFTAVRNANLFGLAAGVVLSANLGTWASRLSTAQVTRSQRLACQAFQGMLAALAVFWLTSVITGTFPQAAGELRRFGCGEKPFLYAHAAARFAGRPGMPSRALAFDLTQAGVYVFENGPGRKIFMDSRLEVPSRSTFETYVWLEERLDRGLPGWDDVLRRLGDPAVLLDHEESTRAEATLLADPRWRCVYFDAVGSVFLSRALPGGSERFPTYDFAARHFHDRAPRHSFSEAFAEAKSLSTLGSALLQRSGSPWTQRIPVALLGSDRAREVLAASPGVAGAWTILGHCYWNTLPDLRVPPPGPADPWDPATGLPVAQATFCYRQAVDRAPSSIWTLLALHDVYEKRRMNDATARMALRVRAARDAIGGGPARGSVASPVDAPPETGDPGRSIEALLDGGRPDAATALAARSADLPWSAVDRAALALLHLGDPAAARRLWERAPQPPSQALRLARLANADHVALDDASAEARYRASLALDPGLGETWFGLALLYAQWGRADEARAACREGLQRSLTRAQRAGLRGIEVLAGERPVQDHH